MKPIKDKYLKARSGKYKIYDIYCSECNAKLFRYQKDGTGVLKRCYIDRMHPLSQCINKAYCEECGRAFGRPYIYEKENRPAIRLFVGAVYKRRTNPPFA